MERAPKSWMEKLGSKIQSAPNWLCVCSLTALFTLRTGPGSFNETPSLALLLIMLLFSLFFSSATQTVRDLLKRKIQFATIQLLVIPAKVITKCVSGVLFENFPLLVPISPGSTRFSHFTREHFLAPTAQTVQKPWRMFSLRLLSMKCDKHRKAAMAINRQCLPDLGISCTSKAGGRQTSWITEEKRLIISGCRGAHDSHCCLPGNAWLSGALSCENTLTVPVSLPIKFQQMTPWTPHKASHSDVSPLSPKSISLSFVWTRVRWKLAVSDV